MVKQPSDSSDKSSNVNEDLFVPAMTIKLVSKNDKFKSIIIDAFRILSWGQFRSEYKVRGLEGYAQFHEVWITHEIHEMSYQDLQKLYGSLGYAMSDLVKIRNDYYARRKVNEGGSENIVIESDQYSFGDNVPF